MTLPARTRDDAAKTAPAILFELAQREPARVRFVQDGQPVALGQLARRVAGFAAWLRGRGIGPGDHVALFAPNSVDWFVAALGVQACGGAFVGVHAGSSADLATYVVEHARAKLCIAASSELARAGIDTLSAPIVPFGPEFDAAASTPAEPQDHSRRDGRACLIYTSGTTGRPKGVVLTHGNLAANGGDWVEVCGPLVAEGAREVLWLPFSHVFGWGDAVIGTVMGFTSHLTPPLQLAPALQAVRPQMLMTVPILLERLARAAESDAGLRAATGGEIQLCLAGGAALSPAVKRRYREAGVRVLEGYGLTETSPTLTLVRPDSARDDTVGTPYPSVEIRLASDGEVLARGPSVFSGYWQDPEATREALDAEGWFHTGDIGERTEGGELRIIDRKKELLVLANGKKVPPQPIEARASEDPWVERMVLFGTGRPSIVALVVPNLAAVARDLGRALAPAAASTDAAVIEGFAQRIAALNARLSEFERIKGFAVAPRPLTVEEGHLTPSFKVKRKAVWSAFEAALEGRDASIPVHALAKPGKESKP